MICFRRLTHEDYDDIVDISRDIWDGTDYLPQVFHDWVEDKGVFLGGIDSETNKVIAVDKFTYLHDGTGWLEGLRVHRDYRGKKIGKKITVELLDKAKEALHKGEVNKIAFSTHIGNIESKTMLEKMGFKVAEAQLLAIKELQNVKSNILLENFKVEQWEISSEEFKNLEYLKRRNNLLPLAFVFQEPTKELFDELKEANSFVSINGHKGIFKYKGEPNFLAIEDSFEAIDTFMNYYLLLYSKKGIDTIYTPVLPEDVKLVEKIKNSGYTTWNDWKPDYFYYIL